MKHCRQFVKLTTEKWQNIIIFYGLTDPVRFEATPESNINYIIILTV